MNLFPCELLCRVFDHVRIVDLGILERTSSNFRRAAIQTAAKRSKASMSEIYPCLSLKYKTENYPYRTNFFFWLRCRLHNLRSFRLDLWQDMFDQNCSAFQAGSDCFWPPGGPKSALPGWRLPYFEEIMVALQSVETLIDLTITISDATRRFSNIANCRNKKITFIPEQSFKALGGLSSQLQSLSLHYVDIGVDWGRFGELASSMNFPHLHTLKTSNVYCGNPDPKVYYSGGVRSDTFALVAASPDSKLRRLEIKCGMGYISEFDNNYLKVLKQNLETLEEVDISIFSGARIAFEIMSDCLALPNLKRLSIGVESKRPRDDAFRPNLVEFRTKFKATQLEILKTFSLTIDPEFETFLLQSTQGRVRCFFQPLSSLCYESQFF